MPCSRRSLALLAILLVSAPLLAAETAPRTRVLATDAAGPAPRVEVRDQGPGGLSLEISIPQLEIRDHALGGETFDAVDLPGGGHLGEVGRAALPTLTRLVALPAGVGADVRITAREMVDLGILRIAPAEAVRAADGDATAAAFDEAAYAASGPSEPAVTVGAPALLHGVRVVPVTISPVAYDPATGRARAASHLSVEVTFGGSDPRNDPAGPRRPLPASFATMLADEVLGFARDADASTAPGTYLMICPQNSTVLSIVEDLAQWRRRRAMPWRWSPPRRPAPATRRSRTGSWTATRPPRPLEFVTLVGDANGAITVPSWREGWSGYNGEGDHQYSLLDGDDVLADVHLGRLSVTSTGQLQDVVDKILAYESAPDMSDPSWFTTAGLTGDPASSGYSTIFVNQFVKQQLLELDYTQIDTIWGGNYLTQMMATIGQGETLFTYRGYWHMSGMTENHILSLANGTQLPFSVILTCDTGSFWSDTAPAAARPSCAPPTAGASASSAPPPSAPTPATTTACSWASPTACSTATNTASGRR